MGPVVVLVVDLMVVSGSARVGMADPERSRIEENRGAGSKKAVALSRQVLIRGDLDPNRYHQHMREVSRAVKGA
jgi:hypothetical protein